jgi:hypothetical protein
MWYLKNLPVWERVLRFVAAALMAGCAWRFGMTPVGAAFAVAAASSVVTALVGYCPLCAIGGRRPLNEDAGRGVR